MSDFMSGFERGAMIQKLRQNQRLMQQMSSEIAKRTVEQIKLQKKVEELRQTIKELKQTNKELKQANKELEGEYEEICYSFDQIHAHLNAEAARSACLMDLLDQAHGEEANPARQIACSEEGYRIPSGNRQGEPLTQADAAYLEGFAKTYKELFKDEWENRCEGWMSFLHREVSY